MGLFHLAGEDGDGWNGLEWIGKGRGHLLLLRPRVKSPRFTAMCPLTRSILYFIQFPSEYAFVNGIPIRGGCMDRWIAHGSGGFIIYI